MVEVTEASWEVSEVVTEEVIAEPKSTHHPTIPVINSNNRISAIKSMNPSLFRRQKESRHLIILQLRLHRVRWKVEALVVKGKVEKKKIVKKRIW